jgi:hypothetical protein
MCYWNQAHPLATLVAKMASIVVSCRTRSWGPGYIVGFNRVKVPSVRSIPYSTTWWVEDRGTYHGWLNRGWDWHTIHHKLVGERSEQMSDDMNVPLAQHDSRLRFVFFQTKLARAMCQLKPCFSENIFQHSFVSLKAQLHCRWSYLAITSKNSRTSPQDHHLSS